MQRFACGGVQRLHALQQGLLLFQLLACFAGTLKHSLRDLAVDLGAGQLFEQLGTLVGVGVQKSRKTALRQQHGLGESSKVQAREADDALELVIAVGGENCSFTRGWVNVCQLYLGWLQCAMGLVTRTALAPEGTVGLAFDGKSHLGHAVGRVARHQIVVAATNAAQARGLVVQGQADGIEQGGLASPRRPGDGKQAVVGKGRLAEVNGKFAFEGVEVFQAQAQDFHAASPVVMLRSTCS